MLTTRAPWSQMRDEVAGLPQDPDYDTIKGLAFTKAVVQETLRCV